MPVAAIHRRTRQVRPGAVVDWSHSIAKGLWRAWMLGPEYRDGHYDLTRRDGATRSITGSLTGYIGSTKLGRGLNTPSSHFIEHASTTFGAGFTNKITAAVWIRYTERDAVYVDEGAGGVGTYGFGTYKVGKTMENGSYWRSSCRVRSTTGNNHLQGTRQLPYTDTKWHLVAFTYDGVTQSLYLDGQFDGSATVVSGTLYTTTTASYAYCRSGGCYDTTESGTFLGGVRTHWVWQRVLSVAELRQLYVDPFCIVKDSRDG